MTTINTSSEQCSAYVDHPPHYLHRTRCERKAKHVRAGQPCCGIHARQADGWEKEGRMKSMIAHWWRP